MLLHARVNPRRLTRNQNCRRETVRQAPLDNREIVRNLLKIGGRACKPDSVPHTNRRRACARGDHSSSPGIATGIQQPTRGFYRAGPTLPSYLALHHAGFSVPPVLPPGRWALTPPFHPCQTLRAFRRRLTGFPVRCHRAPLRRRSILCGTFRSAVVAPALARHLQLRPLALPGALPCQEFRQPLRSRHNDAHKMTNVSQDGVRTFLPPSHLAMTKPAITRPARQIQLYRENF